MLQSSTQYSSDMEELYNLLYSTEEEKQKEGVAMVNVIRLRGHIAVGLDGTAALVSARLSDNGTTDEHTIQSVYSMALIRTVNGLTDRQQMGNYMTSIKTLASRIKLPYSLVDIRHEATHQSFPPLPALRQSAALMMDWLRCNYWEPLFCESHEQTITKCVQELQGYVNVPNQLHPSAFADRLIAANCLTGLPGAIVRVIYRNVINPNDIFTSTEKMTEFRRFILEALVGGLSETFRCSVISPVFGKLLSDALIAHYCIVNMIMHNTGRLTNSQQFDLCIKWLYGILDYVATEKDEDVRKFLMQLMQKATLAVFANAAPPFISSLEKMYKKENVHFSKLESNTEFTLDDVISLNEPVVAHSNVAGTAQISISDTPSGCLTQFIQDLINKYHIKLSSLQILLDIQASDASVIIHRSAANELVPVGASSLLGSMWTDNSRLHKYYYGGLGEDCPVLAAHKDDAPDALEQRNQQKEAHEPPIKH